MIEIIKEDILVFSWHGITLEDRKEKKWLSNLDDENFWGKPRAINEGYQVLFVKEE